MYQVSSDQPRESGKINAKSSDRPGQVTRPGWPEIAVGLIGLGIAGIGSGVVLARLGLDPVLLGVIFTALSGIGGIVGFSAAAASLRIRSLSALGVRRVSGRLHPISAPGRSR